MKKLFSIALFFIFANIIAFSSVFVPQKKSFYITTDNLKVRENEGLNGKALFTLKKDSRIFVLEIGKKEKIDEIDSNWVKIVTDKSLDKDGNEIEQGKQGWCFGGYLSKYKKFTDKEIENLLFEKVSFDREYSSLSFYKSENKVYHSTYREMPDDPHYMEGDFEVKNGKIISDIFGKDDGESGEIDFEYNCDTDNYEIEGFYSAPRTYDSLFYDEENDMLFRKSGTIFIEEECIFYGKPSESSSKATIKELFFFQNESYKVFNLDRVFAETEIETYGRSLYPNKDGSYWYVLKNGVLEKQKNFVKGKKITEGVNYKDTDDEKTIERIKELKAQGILKIEPLTEDEKHTAFYHKGLLVDLYEEMFEEK